MNYAACQTEDDCTYMPWCRIRGECQRLNKQERNMIHNEAEYQEAMRLRRVLQQSIDNLNGDMKHYMRRLRELQRAQERKEVHGDQAAQERPNEG